MQLLPAFARNGVSARHVRLATVCLWLLIVLAAAGGLRALLARDVDPQPVGSPAEAVAVAGFAELFVAAYLSAGSGQEQALRPYYQGPLDLTGVTPSARYAARTTAVEVAHLGSGPWVVNVGAEVLSADGGGYVPAGTHYYRVKVASRGGRFVATALPAEVPTLTGAAP